MRDNLFEIQRNALNTGNWEPLREYYLPSRIKFLLVGEAPPDGGERFFYYDNVTEADNLFLGVMSALFPRETSVYRSRRSPEGKRNLLNKFRALGGYLMDLYPMPKSEKPYGYGVSYFVNDFFQRFRSLKDYLINDEGDGYDFQVITVHKEATNVLPLFIKAGIKTTKLPFPLYGHQEEFRLGLMKCLNINSI